jgi:vancomycin resistance protein YoaR
MKFANDYDSHVLIKTSYTDTSITVSIFGDNDGRIVRGNHKDKKSTLEILQDGGPAARVVTATKTDRFDPIAKPVQLIADKNIPTSAAKIMQKGSDGWKIKIERIITKGGEIFASQEWTVRYRPETAIIKTNSCETFEEIIPCRTTAEQKDFERNLVKQFGSGDE